MKNTPETRLYVGRRTFFDPTANEAIGNVGDDIRKERKTQSAVKDPLSNVLESMFRQPGSVLRQEGLMGIQAEYAKLKEEKRRGVLSGIVYNTNYRLLQVKLRALRSRRT